MAEESAASSWASSIPEVYFDLIARVPAGAVILFAMTPKDLPIFSAKEFSAAEIGPAFALTASFIFFAYVLGLLLTFPSGVFAYGLRGGLWWWMFKMKMKVGPEYPDLRSLAGTFGIDVPDQIRFPDFLRIEFDIHDQLRMRDESSRNLLAKMRAEAELCANLAAAFALLFVFWGGFCLRPWIDVEMTRSYLLAAVASSLLVGGYRIWRLFDRQYYLLRALMLERRFPQSS